MSKFNSDKEYAELKNKDKEALRNIAAFASTFGNGTDDISVATRYQVERFCVNLALKAY